jgi:hypothetical protein
MATQLRETIMIALDPDSLRRRAIDARQRARSAVSAVLRRQFLEIAESFDDLADAVQSVDSVSEMLPAATRQQAS